MSTDRVGGSGIVRRHKATHATGGTDALTPADIGAAATDDVIVKALVNAKGDLITATADDTPARLAVGTNGQALLADSTQATGLRWGSVATSGEDDQIVLGVQVFG